MRELEFRVYIGGMQHQLTNLEFYMGKVSRWKSGRRWWAVTKAVNIVQYIGEKDKNGAKIFEGDRLQWLQKKCVTTGTVRFGDGGFYVENFYNGSQENPCGCFEENAEFKRLGSIYENKELLGE